MAAVRPLRPLLVFAALLVLDACATAPAARDRSGEIDAPARWSGRMTARAQPPITANVVMSPVNANGETVAVISIHGAPLSATAALAWRVYYGSCDGTANVFGDPVDYPVIPLRADGTGQATATIRQSMPTSGVFHVRIHLSPTNLQEVIACGPLQYGAA